jgi:glycosyltransferase involved in cell wall biosynthesis
LKKDRVAIVIYRGPFQGRRLGFLLEAIGQTHDEAEFVWLYPKFDPNTPLPWFDRFMEERPFIRHHCILDGARSALVPTIHYLRRRHAQQSRPIYAIGFTSLWYARALWPRPIVWCIQGIPEEKLMHRNKLIDRLSVAATWRTAQSGPSPKIIVTVSERMAQFVKRYFSRVTCVAAPTCADLKTFRAPAKSERKYLTYLGSGAPWQNLGQLSRIWSALYRADPSLRFKVVSKDKRAEILKSDIPDEAIQITAAEGPSEVARHLWEAELGFLIRTPDIVNEVSFPTKFGEYVAAGVPVVGTDVGWDFSQIIKQTRCGLLVNWNSEPQVIAQEILAYRREVGTNGEIAKACRQAANLMNKEVWVARLSEALRKIEHG